MDDRLRMQAGPLRLTQVQELQREKTRLESEIRRADEKIANLKVVLQNWQMLHQAIERLYATEASRHG